MQKLQKPRQGYKVVKSYFGKYEEIPEEWELHQLSAVAELIMGQSPPGDSYNFNGIGTPLLNGPTEFGIEHPFPIQHTTAPTKLSQKGDILLCVRGSTTGRLNLADQEYCLGRGLASIRGLKGKIHTKWLYYQFLRLQNKIYNIASGGGTTFPNINSESIKNLLIPHPQLEEQKKISLILSEADELIKKTDQIIEQSKRLKKGLIEKLITNGNGRIDMKKTERGEVPKWETRELQDFSTTYRYPTFYGINYNSEGISVLNIGNIDNKTWKLTTDLSNYQKIDKATSDSFSKTIVEEGDIVLAVRGATIGKFALVPKVLSNSNINANLLRIHLDRKICDPVYFWYYTQTHRGKKEFRRFVSSTAKETVQAGRLKYWNIILPGIEEQQRISSVLSAAERKLEKIEQYMIHLGNLKKGLMQKLLTGKIRVKV